MRERSDRELAGIRASVQALEQKDAAAGVQPLVIPRYDMNWLMLTGLFIMVGAPGSGKSYLMTEVMWYLRNRVDAVMGFNPNEDSSQTLEPFTPDGLKFGEFDPKKLKEILDYQRRTVKKSLLLAAASASASWTTCRRSTASSTRWCASRMTAWQIRATSTAR